MDSWKAVTLASAASSKLGSCSSDRQPFYGCQTRLSSTSSAHLLALAVLAMCLVTTPRLGVFVVRVRGVMRSAGLANRAPLLREQYRSGVLWMSRNRVQGVAWASTGVEARSRTHLHELQCSGTEHQDSHDSYATSFSSVAAHGLHIEQARHLQNSHCCGYLHQSWHCSIELSLSSWREHMSPTDSARLAPNRAAVVLLKG